MRAFLEISIGIIFIYIIFCFFIFFIQKYLIFLPSNESFIVPKEKNIEEISINTEDNVKLNAWFVDNKSDKVVIFFHGNGGNIFYNQERIKIFNELHLNAILFDYRGYGKSGGKIQKEDDLYKDADAVYKYLLDKNINSKDIILWGQSLGGAVAINLAQNKDIYGTIIESTFYSMNEMANKQYWFLPTKLLLKYHFKNNEKISNISSSILIIHSINDEMINFSNGKRLFDETKKQETLLKTTGSHNGGFQESYDLYVSEIKKFLKVD